MDSIIEGNFFPDMPEQNAVVYSSSAAIQKLDLHSKNNHNELSKSQRSMRFYRTDSQGSKQLVAFQTAAVGSSTTTNAGEESKEERKRGGQGKE